MALDVFTANQQLWRLSQQCSALQSAKRKMVQYRGELELARVGTEVKYYDQAIDDLVKQCDLIDGLIEYVRKDVSTAIDEIIAEEEADSAAMAQTSDR